jgi:hypothetical protein
MSFERLGWQVFAPEPQVIDWIDHAAPYAVAAANDPTLHNEWLRCGGTWFVGVDALPNDAAGRIDGGPRLSHEALTFAQDRYGKLPLHRAQVSVIYAGYPKQMAGEGVTAFRFRRDRDAAHVDGLLPVGPEKRRKLQEPHAYVLGIPFSDSTASPLVVWDGSHKIMQAAFVTALEGIDPSDWSEIDLTEVYQATRRLCFETCKRRVLHVPKGGAYVVHRHALHGVAAWRDDDAAPPGGRMIAYFRPEFATPVNWLSEK